MRWIVGPVPHVVYATEVADRFHKEVIPETFGTDTAHYTYVDLGKKAGVVKVTGVPISAGVGIDLVTRMILDNQAHRLARGRGDRLAIGVSQNNREGTRNMKLGVASWDMAKKLVQEGVMVGKKKCKVELWGQTYRVTNRRRTGSFPTPPTLGIQNPPKRPWSGNSPSRGFRCYDCGEGGHPMAHCTKGHKCDRCGGWGHKVRDCIKI